MTTTTRSAGALLVGTLLLGGLLVPGQAAAVVVCQTRNAKAKKPVVVRTSACKKKEIDVRLPAPAAWGAVTIPPRRARHSTAGWSAREGLVGGLESADRGDRRHES